VLEWAGNLCGFIPDKAETSIFMGNNNNNFFKKK
jgi:hypothetical protein